MAYTNVSKPTGTPWHKVKNGAPLYDDAVFMYDDPNTYYDGDSPNVYTRLAKPTAGSYTKLTKPI